jgi:Flp pilus assembly protein TadD
MYEAFHYRAKYDLAIGKRGEAYFKIGQFQKAIADYSEAMFSNQDAAIYELRAAAYRAAGEFSKAEWDEKQAKFYRKPKKPETP